MLIATRAPSTWAFSGDTSQGPTAATPPASRAEYTRVTRRVHAEMSTTETGQFPGEEKWN